MANFSDQERVLNTHPVLRRSFGRASAALALLGLWAASSPAAAANGGKIWGRVLDASGRPAAGVVVRLTTGEGTSPRAGGESLTGADGVFQFLAVTPGPAAVEAVKPGLGRAVREGLFVEEGGDIYVRLTVAAAGGSSTSADLSPAGARTTITAGQIAALPSAVSIASIIENQDLSATTHRIDVGGVWETRPGLFSARGGLSWTQSGYYLNGLDVGDPYATGRPLLLPDIFSLSSASLINAAPPAWASGPGGQLVLAPGTGSPAFHGSLWSFYTDASWSSNNVTDALREEGISESTSVNRLMDVALQLDGPLNDSGATFFTSWSLQSNARDTADFDPLENSSVLSGLFHLAFPSAGGGRWRFLGALQSAGTDALGSGRGMPWIATTRLKTLAGIAQAIYETAPGARHEHRLAFSYAAGRDDESLQAGAAGPAVVDIFRPWADRSAPDVEDGFRQTLVLAFDGADLLPDLGIADHRLEYGLRARYASAAFTREIPGGRQLRVDAGEPLEVAVMNGPFDYSAASFTAGAYVQDTVTFASLFSLRAGLNAEWTSGWNGAASLRRLTLSPRAELTFPFSSRRTSAFKVAAGRYFLGLPLSLLAWGNPDAPGSRIYAWTDLNGDGREQEGELGALLRREGPAFSAIDPSLRAPYVDELMLSLVQDFGRGWRFTASGFLRRTRGLIETVATGVTDADYTTGTITDIGDNRIFGDADDLTFTVYNRKAEALGRDFFLLTNPDGRETTYRGADFTLIKPWNGSFLFYLSFAAMEIVGSASPGNTEAENDDGVIGALYDDPNASINAEGRLRFDRAYTVRLGFSAALPLGTRLSVVGKYYDGQPFARKIIVPDLNQGRLFIQAHPRGVARYEFNMTWDVRLEKTVRFGSAVLRLMADVFNLFNQHLATAENEWTGDDFPRRFATEIQSPRLVRAGLQFSF